jgi:pSer/pThr/pTyr-binding forkhead associated (FHA) protein
MGVLCEESTGQINVLETHHLVGRSYHCSLRLLESSVSGEHASLRWTPSGWVLKDLASRYNTFLNAQPIQPGVPVPISKGARLAFGRNGSTWLMTEEGPPEVMVVPVSGGPALFRRDGMIAIPSQEDPVAVAFQSNDGGWMLDQSSRVESIREQAPFVVDSVQWRLCNTSPLLPTSLTGEQREMMTLEEVKLHFEVSRNEEHVEITARWRDRLLALGSRSHHYALLIMARLRVRDRERGEPPAAAGWTAQTELLRLLQVTPERLNLDIFRARRQFGAEGFIPAAGIVERRPTARELRIGVSEVTIGAI